MNLTKQQIFTKGLRHIREQGSFCTVGPQCMYRDLRDPAKPRACIVGCLFPDSAYDPILDEDVGTPAHKLQSSPWRREAEVLRRALAQGGVDTNDPSVLQLLVDMQHAHDCSDGSMEQFEKMMENTARNHHLSYA